MSQVWQVLRSGCLQVCGRQAESASMLVRRCDANDKVIGIIYSMQPRTYHVLSPRLCDYQLCGTWCGGRVGACLPPVY